MPRTRPLTDREIALITAGLRLLQRDAGVLLPPEVMAALAESGIDPTRANHETALIRKADEIVAAVASGAFRREIPLRGAAR